ncbi:MAG: F0F1 ATP synthase subunit delta [Candidatus Methylacidiphilales bacterium]|nr:F0F1 ATP synthase subunit delta [Candidatus Methylacidiphilales bacterium]
MKINREARQAAKKYYLLCTPDGVLNEEKVRHAVNLLSAQKPRNYIQILERFKKLIEIEVLKRTTTVESAIELPDKGASIFAEVDKKFGKALATHYKVNPNLLAGLRIQRGSDVWDGSLRSRLNKLQQAISSS